MWLDVRSICGYTCTIVFSWIGHVTKSDLGIVATLVAILAGISTIIYNSINIYLKIKKK
jgi:uncharacterized membrane protein